jgi:formylglycine-generating enzyme required for sulfatase activity
VKSAADTTAPAAVTNLVATTGTSPGTVELTWIAPGDDATAGTASAYVARYNTTTISESNWDASTDASGEPAPSPAGSVESMTVSGLSPGEAYHFAIRTQDEAPNTSGISNSPAASAQLYANRTYLPLVTSASGTPTVIPETTEVLTEETTEHLSQISGDGAVFTFTQSTPALDALAAGDVIVGDASTNAPYGFLRKVTSVSSTEGQVIVQTEQATLDEAIESGEAHVHHTLTPDQIQSSTQVQGVSLASAAEAQSGFYFQYKLQEVVLFDEDGDLDTDDDQITANGSIRLEPSFDFDMKVRRFELEELSFVASAEETAEIKVTSEIAGLEYKEKKQIARHVFTPITVMAGPVPIVFVPILTVNVGVDGSVHVGISTRVRQEATLRARLEYTDDAWSPVSQFSNAFYFDPPSLSASLDLKGYAGAELSVLLYGVVGPHADINAYLKLEADVAETPWWTLYAGLEMPVGIKTEVLSRLIAGYETTVIDYRLPLAEAQSNGPPYLPSEPYPEDRAVVGDLDLDLTWTGGDPDGDDVTYDVYFEPDDPIPDVQVSSNQVGLSYDPGTLDPNTAYYWRIVAEDAHGATNAGPVWSFTTATGGSCPIELTLQSPQVSDLTVTVHGSASSSCSTVTRLNWQWGDGLSNDQWFPASHTYAATGTYTITVAAYNDLGDTAVANTTAQVGTAPGDVVTVPAGEFQMGCDETNPDEACYGDEQPLHTVYLDAYAIDKYEVTNAQYAEFLNAEGNQSEGGDTWLDADDPDVRIHEIDGMWQVDTAYEDHPVIEVTWYGARAYCQWQGKRLPTEAEWEKAARGSSDTRIYPWGAEDPDCSRLNYYDSSEGHCVGDTAPVGSSPSGASPYGAVDVAGNVWEWVNDWYDMDYYDTSPYANPPGPASGAYKVLRGGGWSSYLNHVRVAYRTYYFDTAPYVSSSVIGFRCVGVAPGRTPQKPGAPDPRMWR